MVSKKVYFLLFGILIFLLGCQNQNNVKNSISEEIYFCPYDDCDQKLAEYLDSATQSINCAFFDLNEPNIIALLNTKQRKGLDVNILIDSNNFHKIKGEDFNSKDDSKRISKYDNFMHNKFCIVDSKSLYLGSANPTINGLTKNDNVVFLINNYELSKDFLFEFNQMYYGQKFGSLKKQNPLSKTHKTKNNGSLNVYFCPQDNCEEKLLDELSISKKNIYFANFVLTADFVEQLLLIKKEEGIDVQGVVEKRNSNSKGSQIGNLSKTFPLVFDKNKNTMHHKYFVIDDETIVVGSMNPTRNGMYYNDEFLMVIKDKEIAKKFKNNYFSLI